MATNRNRIGTALVGTEKSGLQAAAERDILRQTMAQVLLFAGIQASILAGFVILMGHPARPAPYVAALLLLVGAAALVVCKIAQLARSTSLVIVDGDSAVTVSVDSEARFRMAPALFLGALLAGSVVLISLRLAPVLRGQGIGTLVAALGGSLLAVVGWNVWTSFFRPAQPGMRLLQRAESAG